MADAAVAPANIREVELGEKKKKPSMKDKMKKKIQGREEFKVVTEEGGLLSEVQKVVQANVSGGTLYKVGAHKALIPPQNKSIE